MITSRKLLVVVVLLPSLAAPAVAWNDRRSAHRYRQRDQGTKGGLSVSISVGSAQDSHLEMTPNGIKAGISAGDAYDFVKDHIGWWYGSSCSHSHWKPIEKGV